MGFLRQRQILEEKSAEKLVGTHNKDGNTGDLFMEEHGGQAASIFHMNRR